MTNISITANKPGLRIARIFQRDYKYYQGVPRINIYLLRLIFALTFFVVGKDSWTVILTFKGTWDPVRAVAFSVWAAYSLLCFLGLYHTLKMLPIIMFQIFYKTIWLAFVALPLWSSGKLAGSPAEEMTYVFLWIILAYVAMPWKYFMQHYVLPKKKSD